MRKIEFVKKEKVFTPGKKYPEFIYTVVYYSGTIKRYHGLKNVPFSVCEFMDTYEKNIYSTNITIFE